VSLLDDIMKAVGISEDSEEMVLSPPPPQPTVTKLEGESDLDYSLRKRKTLFEWKKLMEDRELNPGKYMVPASKAAEMSEPEDRRTTVEKAYGRSAEELQKLDQ